LTPKKTLTHEESQIETNIDYDTIMVIVGLVGDEDAQEIIAAASYYLASKSPNKVAEFALMISKDWQHLGIGYHLFNKMCEIACEKGVDVFIGDFMKTNIGIHKILDRLPYSVEFEEFEEIIEYRLNLKAP
jgi:hypothetical protein